MIAEIALYCCNNVLRRYVFVRVNCDRVIRCDKIAMLHVSHDTARIFLILIVEERERERERSGVSVLLRQCAFRRNYRATWPRKGERQNRKKKGKKINKVRFRLSLLSLKVLSVHFSAARRRRLFANSFRRHM